MDGPFLDKSVHLALGASHDWAVSDQASINGGATLVVDENFYIAFSVAI